MTADNHGRGAAIAYVPAIEGLRGLAILLVVTTHFGAISGLPTLAPAWLAPWVERGVYVGWIGVDLFFVLSGYLITSILLSSRDQPNYYRRFYARRVLRIFPVYVVALVLAFGVLPRVWPEQLPWLLADATGRSLWFWTYTVNVANAFGWLVNAGVLAQMWSLAIEEQFYAVWPLVVKRLSPRRIVIACTCLAAGALVLRVVWMAQPPVLGWASPYRFTLTRVDALALGAGLAAASRIPAAAQALSSVWTRRGRIVCWAAFAGWFVLAPRFYPDQPGVVTYGHSLLALAFGGLLLRALDATPPRWMTAAWLRLAGKYSYGAYVWHWPLQIVMVRYCLPGWHPALFFATGVFGSMLFGAVSYAGLERPFLRLKLRFPYESGPASRAEWAAAHAGAPGVAETR